MKPETLITGKRQKNLSKNNGRVILGYFMQTVRKADALHVVKLQKLWQNITESQNGLGLKGSLEII